MFAGQHITRCCHRLLVPQIWHPECPNALRQYAMLRQDLNPYLVIVGTNHRRAGVELRERFWLGDSRLYPALQELSRAPGVEEAVILTTCNRTEFILWCESLAAGTAAVFGYLTRDFGLLPIERDHFYEFARHEALQHVFRVTAGLDSMVIGEPEITGQVKAAWAKAQHAGTTGRFLDSVFQKALNVAKRVRSETAIGQAAVSVPYAAVQLARQIFGSLKGRKVMILGAGKMSELAVRYLVSSGAAAVRVTNRTYEHAVALAGELGGEAVPFEQRWIHLAEADIVISSTGCPHFVLRAEDLERIHRSRHGRPIFLIDIAVPRDIHPEVREVPGVFLYDIDDLQQVVARNLAERKTAAVQAEKIVAHEAERFARKLEAERIVPTIVAVRRCLEEIKNDELQRYRAENVSLDSAQQQAIEHFAAQLVARISNQLARELKLAAQDRSPEVLTTALRQLFRLPAPRGLRTQTADTISV